MDDLFVKSLSPGKAAAFALQNKQLKVMHFAWRVGHSVGTQSYEQARTVLVDRGRRIQYKTWYGKRVEKIAYDVEAAWLLGYHGPREPHMRHLYLLVDGSLALDSIGARERYCAPDSSWIKFQKMPYPDLVLLKTSDLPDTKSCATVAGKIGSWGLRFNCMTPELVRLFESIVTE